MDEFKSVGKLIFDPVPITGKAEKMFKPFWAIIVTNDDVDAYYRWFLQKRFNLILQKPAWGPHITIADGQPTGKKGTWDIVKSQYNNLDIEFTYDNFPRTNARHWWLKAHCLLASEIRSKLQVQRENLRFPLHLTLGMPIPRHEQHSIYIHKIETQGFSGT